MESLASLIYLTVKSPFIMEERGLGTFCRVMLALRGQESFLLTSSLSLQNGWKKWLSQNKRKLPSREKTSLWLCVFRQIGLNPIAAEVKRHWVHLGDSRFDYFYMRIRKLSLAGSHFSTLTTESLSAFDKWISFFLPLFWDFETEVRVLAFYLSVP